MLLLRRLNELYSDQPFFRMGVTLEVNRKGIHRLMRILGIEALFMRPSLSKRKECSFASALYYRSASG